MFSESPASIFCFLLAMGVCRCIFGVFGLLLAVPLLLICSVCIPQVERDLTAYLIDRTPKVMRSFAILLSLAFGNSASIRVAYIRFYETYAIDLPPLRLVLLILGQVPRIWEHGHLP